MSTPGVHAEAPDLPPVEVEAAGGVLWRVADGVTEVVVVHRPRYDDWSLPKGKLDAGESHEQAAVREVEEETGYQGVPGHELVEVRYRDGKGRSKAVRYWEMTVAGGAFRPNAEVDELRWVPLDAAAAALSYDRDRAVLASFRAFADRG